MKTDWRAIHKLLDVLKDVEETGDLQVYISMHGLPDARIDDVMSKISTGFNKAEDMTPDGRTGWTTAATKYDALGFKKIELTIFFDVYNKHKHEARIKQKGGDKK